MRAAYYCGLPAYGPIPLPRIVERWTVPRGSFIHKKSQENFERKTLRRMIQIKDGHPETVELWLSFLKENAYYGIGMKANIWSFEKIGMLLPPFPWLWYRIVRIRMRLMIVKALAKQWMPRWSK
jgi:ribosomal protein S10